MPEGTAVIAPVRASSVLPVEMREVAFAAGGLRLIDRLTLTLEAGSRTVILGPNGAGKSLTLRLLHGLIAPLSGEIRLAGRVPDAAMRRKVALVFQRPVLLRRSVAGNLGHALRVYGVPRAARAERIEELLAVGGLEALRGQPARALSGGEQQRLSIVRALAAAPELLLLDEPTASLDPRSTQAIEGLIDKAHAAGTKVVVVTHDLAHARRVADEVVFLHRGRVTERTPAAAFFAAPASEAARAYLEGRLLI